MKKSSPELGQRFFTVPDLFESMINNELKKIRSDLSLDRTHEVAEAIEKLNDFYIHHPQTETPWDKTWCQIAYLTYYFPLNYIRCLSVLDQIKPTSFFDKVKTILDFASGPGTAALALQSFVKGLPTIAEPQIFQLEKSPFAKKISQAFFKHFAFSASPQHSDKYDLFMCSYGLTELANSPEILFKADRIILIEPSTYDRSQSLIQLRERLRGEGYFMWAPCPHRQACPLANDPRDWCHDRIHFTRPTWFEKIEYQLKTKNSNLTFSYLVASKEDPAHQQNLARTISDARIEKGKIRSLICHSSEKKMLSWLPRESEQEPLARGILFEFPSDTEVKGSSELRTRALLKLKLS